MTASLSIYPAIDLLDGRCVRLRQGAFDAVTTYSEDPVATAARFREAGATFLHLVDLSGARAPEARQTSAILDIVARSGLRVQTGGGLRTVADAAALLEGGADRVVIGSAALETPAIVLELMDRFGQERVTLALDVRVGSDGRATVARHGWQSQTLLTPKEALAPFAGRLLPRLLVTDIGRDGMMTGPNLGLYLALEQELAPTFGAVELQVSGGISGLEDVVACRAAGLPSVILGRALYEGRISLEEALKQC